MVIKPFTDGGGCKLTFEIKMATIEELTGLIAGLSSVVKGLTTNVAEISTQVGQLTNAGISVSISAHCNIFKV
jgi:hypothetical protein